ncbi:testis-expressed protein 13D [Hyaena hyaena]|uniref:testis-expressed protein 13D n=1 Tax=Hyaena hyaena TaxID=95912 RepID=UPI0019248601|nr:testis-expressed protein 13D [Hyaena hyaena]
MAVDLGDPASGFRHTEVIRFINDEVLMNGGGPDFYAAFRSRPWNEVEDRLQAVLADPQVPHAIKRACTWSALALSVRVGARQREQQGHWVQRLQDQLNERKMAARGMASELQWLRMERESAISRLRSSQAALQQALRELDVLHGRLLQMERSSQFIPWAHEIVPGPPAEQLGAVAWPWNAEQQRDAVAMGSHAPPAVLYMPGPPSPWAQAVQPPLPVPVQYLPSFHAPFPVGVPILPPPPPAVVMDAEATVVPHQMPPPRVDQPGPSAAVGYQEVMAPLCDQQSYSQEEDPAIHQSTAPLRDTRSLSQEGPERLQGMVPVRDSWSQSQEEGPEWAQGTVSVEDSWSESPKKSPKWAQGMVSVEDSWNQSQEESPENAQGMVPLGDSWSQSQEEGPEWAQGVVLLDNRGQIREEGPENPQGMVPLGDSWSLSQEEGSEKSQETVALGASRMNSQEEDPERRREMVPLGAKGRHSQEDPDRPQEMVPLGVSGNHSQKECPKRPQGMAPLVASRSNSQEEDLDRPQEMLSLGASGNYSQEEGPERYPLGFRGSHSLEEGLQRPQANLLGDSRSCGVRERPVKQQPQGQKAKQPKRKKALDFRHQEKSASGCRPVNWECPWCKAMNFSRCKTCYKCKKVCVEVESRGLDSGQTH